MTADVWEVTGDKDFECISDWKGIWFVSLIGLTVVTVFMVSMPPVARYKEVVLKWTVTCSISHMIYDSQLSLCVLFSVMSSEVVTQTQ
jgi:hypothetical protein